jgi:hypothetical protein
MPKNELNRLSFRIPFVGQAIAEGPLAILAVVLIFFWLIFLRAMGW